MPPRVVTADLEAILGVPVEAVVPFPYRDGAAVPGPLTNGRFLDVLVRLPAGVRDAGELHQHAHEIPPRAVGRLRQADANGGGHLHEIWGYPRQTAALSQEEADAGPRVATVTFDLGALLNARVTDARPIQRGDGRVVPEVLIESPTPDATRPSEHIYDALEDHPRELRNIVERGEQVRRERATDDPPAWGRTKTQDAIVEALSRMLRG